MELEGVETRLRRVEQLVYGVDEAGDLKGDVDEKSVEKLLKQVSDMQTKLQSAMKSRESLGKAVAEAQTEDIMRFLRPGTEDDMTQSVQSKIQIIDSQADAIRRSAALLSQLETLQSALDSEHIRSATEPKRTDELRRLRLVTNSQQTEVETHTHDVSTAIAQYNRLLHALSRQFTAWDAAVAAAEQKKGIRPKDDSQ